MVQNTNYVKKLAILGSTGSIGRQTLDIVRSQKDKLKVVALAAGGNLIELEKQVKEFKPSLVYHLEPENRLNVNGCRYAPMEEISSHPEIDIVVAATSGKAGLGAILSAIQAGKIIALSNKEPLVMAGAIITEKLKKSRAALFPVDSEHSAIWQCLQGEKVPAAKLLLTASGGPFRGYSAEQLEAVTVEQALQHPSWKMGEKVTIDSATLMNKGLEVIEAHWLFGMPYEKIDILLHPQSVVHSMVEFADGSIKAQLGYPDMRLPIQYALSYPVRFSSPDLPHLDWSERINLLFEKPDLELYPCLRLAIQAGKQGGTYPAVLCGADETAVCLFLEKRIKFNEIAVVVERTLSLHKNTENPGLEEILAAEQWAREHTLNLCEGGS